ncbi:MAG: helix-turn-helix domain-containing protein [Chryseolinea sp.]
MDKTTIAKKIIHHRKLKGMTQEALSELTGLNVRTIQRIEAGEVDPRMYTLKSIADGLGINLEELLPEPSQHELNQIAILHVTPAGFFLFPVFGNILLPFIFWMLKREEVNGINRHGKDILNGQLTYSIVISIFMGAQTVIGMMPMFYPESQLPQEYFRRFPYFIIPGMVVSLIVFGIFPAMNALRVYHGKEPFRYLLKISFFK